MNIRPSLKISRVWLYLTERCNERCIYCEDREFFKSPKDISEKVLKGVFDFLRANNQTTNIEFWGGEPLLRQDLIKYCTTNHPEHFYLLATNGVLINEDILTGIGKVIFSCDGRKVVQDFQRPLVNGLGSYDIIKWDLLRKINPVVHICRYPKSGNLIEEVKFFIKQGFTTIQIEFCEGVTPNDEDLNIYCDELRYLAKYYPSYIINWDTFGIKYANDGNKFMGSNEVTITFDTNGDMYLTCFFARRKIFKFGNVFDGYDDKILDMVLQRFNNNERCKSCICHNNCIHMGSAGVYSIEEEFPTILSNQCIYLRKEHEIVLNAKAERQRILEKKHEQIRF